MNTKTNISLIMSVVVTIFFCFTLMRVSDSMAEHKKQTQEALGKMIIRMDAIDKGMESKLTSQQLSGHLIGVRTSLKEILIILNK